MHLYYSLINFVLSVVDDGVLHKERKDFQNSRIIIMRVSIKICGKGPGYVISSPIDIVV